MTGVMASTRKNVGYSEYLVKDLKAKIRQTVDLFNLVLVSTIKSYGLVIHLLLQECCLYQEITGSDK